MTFKKLPYRYSASKAKISRRANAIQKFIDPGVVFSDLMPDLREFNEGFAWACCPFHDDNNPSFCVNLESGWYKCHSSSCGVTGSNIVGFVSALHACEYSEARRYLEQHYG